MIAAPRARPPETPQEDRRLRALLRTVRRALLMIVSGIDEFLSA